MATSNMSLYTACFSLLLLITGTTNAAPVDDVCAKTEAPPLCLDALGGPDSRSKPLFDAAELGFQTVGPDVIEFKTRFQKLAGAPTATPRVRDLSAKCETIYDHTFQALIVPAHESGRVGRWADVLPYADQIVADIDSCERLFNNNSPVYEDSRKSRVAAEAIGYIAQTLAR